MNINRREFVATAGAMSLMSLAGCNEWRALTKLAGDSPSAILFVAPEQSATDEVTHVIRRLSYGPRPEDLAYVRSIGIDAYIDEQLQPENIDDGDCDFITRRFETLDSPVGELFEYKKEFLHRELAQATLLRSIHSRRQLYEVMVEFWSDHFNIASSKGDCAWLKTADDRDVIRKHALGTFPDLVRASALSPAMLWYLDGRVNRRKNEQERPNENYARELLELHTLGIYGGYTQTDVMEVARCLTGWTVRSEELFGKGRVEFRPNSHDDGEKIVLGQRLPAGLGEGDLERVIAIVTNHSSTAQHIASKLCRRFIDEDPPQDTVDSVAAVFARTGGDIRNTLRALFASESFRSARDAKFKRPNRYVVSALRATGAETDNGDGVLEYLQRMGQMPFQYPTPDGYPDEPEPWMATLLWRWHFAAALGENRIAGVRVDWSTLEASAGGLSNLVNHLLGRTPTAAEERLFMAKDAGASLALASPTFQRF